MVARRTEEAAKRDRALCTFSYETKTVPRTVTIVTRGGAVPILQHARLTMARFTLTRN